MRQLRIVSAGDTRVIERLLTRRAAKIAPFDRQVRPIVDRVRRRRRSRACGRSRGGSTASRPPLEVTANEMRRRAERVRSERPAGDAARRRATSRASRSGRFRSHWDLQVTPGVTIEQRVEPLARVGCYVPGGRFPLPSSLLMTAVPARVAGVAEVIAVCPRPEPVGHGGGARSRRHAAVPRRRRARDRRARVRHRHHSARGQDRRAREPLRRGGQGARRGRLRHRLLRRADRDRDRRRRADSRNGSPPISWRRPSTIPMRASILITWSRRFAERVARAVDPQRGGPGRRRALARRTWRDHRRRLRRRGDGAREPLRARAPRRRSRVAHASAADHAGAVFVGPFTAQAAGDYATGSNHVLPTSGAARFRGGLSAADFVRVMSVQRLTQAGA